MKKIIHKTRSLNKIVLGCAATALAAQVFDDFDTFHGLFKYPLALLNIFSFVMLFAYRNIFLEYRIFIFFLLFNIFFIFGVYILTPYDLVWHLQTSIKRLILQTSGFYFFIFIALYNKKILKF